MRVPFPLVSSQTYKPLHGDRYSIMEKYTRQCLLDQATHVLSTYQCPSCGSSMAPIASGGSSSMPSCESIYTNYTNEGGTQKNLDILPDLKEEAYIETHPEARPARALHVMCAEGDVEGVVKLLQDVSDDMEKNQLANMLRYQDPFAGGATALHIAIENFREDVAWLLLWIASSLPSDRFPEAARRDAASIDLQRSTAFIGGDIRAVKNESGQTTGDLARIIGGIWIPFVSSGVFDS